MNATQLVKNVAILEYVLIARVHTDVIANLDTFRNQMIPLNVKIEGGLRYNLLPIDFCQQSIDSPSKIHHPLFDGAYAEILQTF